MSSAQATLAILVRDGKGAALAQASVTVKEKGAVLGPVLKTDATGKATFAWSFADRTAHELAVEVSPTGTVVLPQAEVASVSAGDSASLAVTCLERITATVTAGAGSASTAPTGSAATTAPQFAVVQASSGQAIKFPAPFPSVPVVVTSAQAGGRACARTAGPAMWVQWLGYAGR